MSAADPLDTPVATVRDFNSRAQNTLRKAGVVFMGDLCSLSERDAWQFYGMGRNTMNNILEALAQHGLHFGMVPGERKWSRPSEAPLPPRRPDEPAYHMAHIKIPAPVWQELCRIAELGPYRIEIESILLRGVALAIDELIERFRFHGAPLELVPKFMVDKVREELGAPNVSAPAPSAPPPSTVATGDPPKTMTVPEAGRKYFNIGKAASYQAAERGDIPTIRIGRRMVVSVAEMEKKFKGA